MFKVQRAIFQLYSGRSMDFDQTWYILSH